MEDEGTSRSRQLWAPWRLQYIVTTDEKPQTGCFLCRYREAGPDRDQHVIAQDDQTLVVLNRFPYNNGHLLIAPCAHKAELDELDDSELLGCMRQLQRMTRLLRKTISPDGFNIGLNLGRVAGAGLPGHLHWHLVPRWQGDTNFMPVIADTKVIPQSLEALSELLRSALAAEP
ncbi:MAG: HIT domain-containing protein [Planctomycetes bacterium]|nr:HIT domain-containing protein [Planctomycetota bacterium]